MEIMRIDEAPKSSHVNLRPLTLDCRLMYVKVRVCVCLMCTYM